MSKVRRPTGRDLCTPQHITVVKYKPDARTARFLHEKLGIPIDQLDEELQRHLRPKPPRTSGKPT